jgi:hypothetical protein
MNTERLEVLISDGGPGIEDSFVLQGMSSQRCQWHGKRVRSFILYSGGAKKVQQKEIIDDFYSTSCRLAEKIYRSIAKRRC